MPRLHVSNLQFFMMVLSQSLILDYADLILALVQRYSITLLSSLDFTNNSLCYVPFFSQLDLIVLISLSLFVLFLICDFLGLELGKEFIFMQPKHQNSTCRLFCVGAFSYRWHKLLSCTSLVTLATLVLTQTKMKKKIKEGKRFRRKFSF